MMEKSSLKSPRVFDLLVLMGPRRWTLIPGAFGFESQLCHSPAMALAQVLKFSIPSFPTCPMKFIV